MLLGAKFHKPPADIEIRCALSRITEPNRRRARFGDWPGGSRNLKPDSITAVWQALEKAGIVFLSNDTMGEGVRFAKPPK